MESKGIDKKIQRQIQVFMPLRLTYKPFFTHHMKGKARFITNASWLFITSQSMMVAQKTDTILYGMKQKGKEKHQKFHQPC